MNHSYDFRKIDYSQMTLVELATEIYKAWQKIFFGANPYLEAMATMHEKDPYKANHPRYGTGQSIVHYFLANAKTFRGHKAKAIKAELTKRLEKEGKGV
jgi:hypothetical protein